MQHHRSFAIVLAWILAVAALSSRSDAYVAYWNLAYESPAPLNQRSFDVFLPSDNGPTPPATIILIHGGSYIAGDKNDFTPTAVALANLGLGVVNMNYMLATPTGGSFPQPIYDVYSIIRWIRTEGLNMGLSPVIVIVGGSAGATIGNAAANAVGSPAFTPPPLAFPNGYAVDGLVSFFGRSDLVWNYGVGLPATVFNYIGMPVYGPGTLPVLAAASPVTYVNSCSPPSVIYHGTADPLIPYQNSIRFADALTQAGVPNQLTIVPGGNHSLDIVGGHTGAAQIIADAVPWFIQNIQPGCDRGGFPALGACCPGDGSCTVLQSGQCSGAWLVGLACAPWRCPVPGACCHTDGTCEVVLPAACTAPNVFRSGQACDPGLCPVFGACCDLVGQCRFLPYASCAEGDWTPNVACTPSPCPPIGACCRGNGTCFGIVEYACIESSWIAGATCQPSNPCPAPGACCVNETTCVLVLQSACAGVWLSAPVCAPGACGAIGACCDGTTCTMTLASACAGLWLDDFACGPNLCEVQAAQGACCMGATCAVRALAQCSGAGTQFHSNTQACNAVGNSTAPCCQADYNKVGGVGVQDIFDFLAGWFGGSPRAGITTNGAGVPGVQDIFDFLAAWFTGCS